MPPLREQLMRQTPFDQWVQRDREHLAKVTELRGRPSANPSYEPQFVYEQVSDHLHLLLLRHGRGDPVSDLKQHLYPLLDAWEEAERLGKGVWGAKQQRLPVDDALCLGHHPCFKGCDACSDPLTLSGVRMPQSGAQRGLSN